MSAKVIPFPRPFRTPVERKADRLADYIEMAAARALEDRRRAGVPPADEREARAYRIAELLTRIADEANSPGCQAMSLMDDVKAGRPPPEDEHGRRGYELAQRILEAIAAAPERRK